MSRSAGGWLFPCSPLGGGWEHGHATARWEQPGTPMGTGGNSGEQRREQCGKLLREQRRDQHSEQRRVGSW